MSGLELPEAPPVDGATHLHSGKVRDLYTLPDGHLLMVASDRISAFDFVLETPIPEKGEILTRMSLWWFDQLSHLVPNHLVSTDVPDAVRGRAIVCERLDMFPVECVARGYLTGSGLLDYRRTGEVCGIPLPAGLQDGSRLSEPIFTPATKAALGDHDENVSYDAVASAVGDDEAEELRMLTLAVYARAEKIARKHGLILADTKFEFGARPDGTTVLADEVLTPDSSRFWPADQWQPGRAQSSYDKQIVRDWLLSDASGWDRASGEAPPPLPDEVVDRTRTRYREAYELLTGEILSTFSCTVELPVQPSDLFRFLAEPRNRPLWQSTLRTVTDIDAGDPHPGQQWRDVTKFGIRPWMELTDLVPFRLLAEAGTWHGVDGLLSMRFLKVSGGVRVNVDGRLIGRGPFAVAAAASGRWAPLTIQKDLQRASKVILERQAAADD